MSLQSLQLTWEAFLTCASHALSTEKQEIMGLLLGSWLDDHNEMRVGAVVRHVMVMTRTDRRKDRVEVGYEQLAEATEAADRISRETGVETRVIGWYHSHPHITVLPSHVDIRTQAQYQAMDAGFVGLILAVFQEDNTKAGRLEVMAFQSVQGHGLSSSSTATAGGALDPISLHDHDDMMDLDVATAVAQEASLQPQSAGPGGGDWQRKEIPITIGRPWREGGGVSSSLSLSCTTTATTTLPVSEACRALVGLQEILGREERLSYLAAYTANTRNSGGGASGGGDTVFPGLHTLYDSAVYSKALACMLEESAVPLLGTLETMLVGLRRRNDQLRCRMEAKLKQTRGGDGEGAMVMEMDSITTHMDDNGGRGAGGDDDGQIGGEGGSHASYLEVVLSSSSTSGAGATSSHLLSRGSILTQVAKGVPGRVIIPDKDKDKGVTTKEVLIRLERKEGASGFGWWELAVGGDSMRLVGIKGKGEGGGEGEDQVDGGCVSFVVEGGGGEGEWEGKSTIKVQFPGPPSYSDLWLTGVRPLLFPQLV